MKLIKEFLVDFFGYSISPPFANNIYGKLWRETTRENIRSALTIFTRENIKSTPTIFTRENIKSAPTIFT
jgi:hypothetical protein